MTVTLLTHPVVQGKVSDLRLVSTSSKQFRFVSQLTLLLSLFSSFLCFPSFSVRSS